MTTYTTNEIHPRVDGDNHNGLYMIVGIILALMIAGFAFYYYTGGHPSSFMDSSAGTVVERTTAPTTGSAEPSSTNTLNLRTDNGNGVSATTTTTR